MTLKVLFVFHLGFSFMFFIKVKERRRSYPSGAKAGEEKDPVCWGPK